MPLGGHDVTTVYTPRSALRRPGLLIREMLRDLINSRELAWRLFVRDISAQYRQSLLGYVWVFIPPLVAALPFVLLKSGGVVTVAQTPIPYPAFALVGTVIWQSFVDGLSAPLRAVSHSRSMLTRVNFPREAILLSAAAQVAFSFVVRLVLIVAVFAAYQIAPAPTALLFPLGVASLILVGFVLGVILTPLGVLYGDVQQGLPVAATLLMFLTPVLYPPPSHGLAAKIAEANPLTPLVNASRDWLTTGPSASGPAFLLVTAVALICLVLGWIAYRLAMPHLIARLGN